MADNLIFALPFALGVLYFIYYLLKENNKKYSNLCYYCGTKLNKENTTTVNIQTRIDVEKHKVCLKCAEEPPKASKWKLLAVIPLFIMVFLSLMYIRSHWYK